MKPEIQEQIGTLRIWDTGDINLDRYTVVWPDGGYLNMEAHPFHPQGVCQHGEGAQYDPVHRLIGGNLYSYLGKEIQFSNLPEDCQEAVMRDILGSSPPGVKN